VKLVRPAVAVAVGAGLVLSGTAGAVSKPKPVCNQVTDAAGDATGFYVLASSPLPSDPNLDILSGDVAADKKNVTAVIRLAAVGSDSLSPTGDTYYFTFSIAGTKYYLEAAVEGSSSSYTVGTYDATGLRSGLGAATGAVIADKKEIHITAPNSVFGAKSGNVIGDMDVLAQRLMGVPSSAPTPTHPAGTFTADEAVGSATTKVGAPSCVVVGK